MTSIEKAALMVAGALIGMDLADRPSRTGYYPRQPKTPDPKKRAKVKAARKQRKATP